MTHAISLSTIVRARNAAALLFALSAAAVPARAQSSTTPTACPSAAQAPQLLNERAVARRVSHAYPAGLLASGVTGHATLALTVGADGRVHDVALVGATHSAFGQVARSVAKTMQFAPARNGSAPVACTVTVPVDFALADG